MAVKVVKREVPTIDHNLTNLHPVLQNIYLSRGISQQEELAQELSKLLPYNSLSNIESATSLIYKHLINKNNILIVGDFDGDGATSTALAVSYFKQLGANIKYLVPNRFEYGYGLSVKLVETAYELKPDLLITVDSGIVCLPGVKAAKDYNIDVLITDHHLPGDILPEADVIVNPNLKDDKFASKNLAGVGVIFYVLLALRSKLREENWFALNNKPEINMAQFLDLVALGTVTDLVPLDYNNRLLVANGLKRFRNGQCRTGIKALLKIAKKNHKTIVASDLGFAIGPRLNAAGRLDDMSLGIDCLLSDDPMHAFSMAESLDALNHERKMIERDMKTEALAIISQLNLSENDKELPLAFCLYQDNWHQGVIGIVAARVKELYHRPVIVFAKDNKENIKGSCRSIEGVHMRDVLQSVATNNPGLITKFGGHAMAAGLSIKTKDFERFNKEFVTEISKVLGHDDIYGRFDVDEDLTSNDLNIDFAQLIKDSGPWGQKFPEPLFTGTFWVMEQRILSDLHMSFRLKPCEDNFKGSKISAIMFNCSEKEWFNTNVGKVSLVYKLDINEYNNQTNIQLLVEHLEVL